MRHHTRISPVLLLSIALLFSLTPGVSSADDATVLPKGTWRLFIDSTFFLPITKRFNKHGDAEDVAKDFNVSNLNANIFQSLAAVDTGFGLPVGTSSLGKSIVTFRWMLKEMTIQPAYGLTDKLSIGMNIPYKWLKNSVTARIDNTTANVGKTVTGAGFGAPIAPLGTFGDEVKLTTEDVQSLLGPGLRVGTAFIPGLGFKRIETFQDDGFGDIQVGGKYQYYTSDHWRLAFTGGLQVPTGKIHDPDSLVDRGFGSGAYALLFWFHQDYLPRPPTTVSSLGIPEAGSFFANTTFRYFYYLPDKQELRVCNVNAPICSDKDNVRRKLGDVVEAEISGSYGITKSIYISPLYKYGHSFKDYYAGDKQLDYGTLSDQTDYNEHIYKVSLTYTTLPAVIDGTFSIPITASISFRERFAGDNNLFKSRFIGFTIAVYF